MLPTPLLRVIAKLRGRSTWVFGLPDEDVRSQDIWNREAWRNGDQQKFLDRHQSRDDDLVVESYVSDLASVVVGMVDGDDVIDVLDFGGGNGSLFFALRRTSTHIGRWLVLDTSSESFDVAFADLDDSAVAFATTDGFLAAGGLRRQADILVSNTTLQYCDDIPGIMRWWKELAPRKIVLSRFLATVNGLGSLTVPQRFQDGTTRCTFLDVEELEELLSPDYRLLRNDPIRNEDLAAMVCPDFPLDRISRYSRFLVFGRTEVL